MLSYGKRLVWPTLREEAPRIGMMVVLSLIRETSRKTRRAIWDKVVTESLLKTAMDRGYFDFLESMGFHLIPIHYHQPIPDTRTLKAKIWNRTSELIGLEKDKSVVSFSLHYQRDAWLHEVLLSQTPVPTEPSEARAKLSGAATNPPRAIRWPV